MGTTSSFDRNETMLLTTNILQKTFLIRHANLTGTAFAVEWEGRQYLVTAKHVVPDPTAQLEVRHDDAWKYLPCNGIYHHPGKADIAVITLSRQIAPPHPLELSPGGFSLGQDTAILGFPFRWSFTQFDINNGYPTPFVKSATFSAMVPGGDPFVIILDGHSNPGFSGGPVIIEGSSRNDLKVIGVVTAADNESTPAPNQFDPPLKELHGIPVPDDHVHPTNAGFIRSHSIKHAIELIELNPYGYDLAT